MHHHTHSPSPEQLALPFPTAGLQQIDPARNMARFYTMAAERDLFGRVVLVRRWGRIGTWGRTRLDEHPNEGEALAALAAIKAQKSQRGYR